jgi:type I restriction enzyme S subunit
MNADLIDGLAHATDSCENVPHLRRLVVALAISGKLDVSNDEEFCVPMGERLQAKREQLIKIGKLKRQGEVGPIPHDELPAGVSNASHFERLGNLATLAKGPTGIQSAAPGRFPLVVTAEERSSCDHFDFDGAAAIVPMVSSAGHGKARINRLHYQEGKFALGSILCAIFPISKEIISARFLYEYLTAFKEELLVPRMIGTANVSLTIGKIAEVPVPLVSRRIQQRVEGLMALCDRLEAAQEEREKRRDRLAAASLHSLNNGGDADEFRDHARFYFNLLPRLTTRPEHIQQLRKTILNLAVRGKLVPQDSKDEPASELLQRIKTEKTRLVKEGKIKPPLVLREIPEGTVPFWLPTTWQWVRFGELIIDADAGWSPKSEGFPRLADNWGVLKVSSVSWDKFLPEENKQLLPGVKPPTTAQVRAGDFLISRANTSELVAKCVVVGEQPKNLILSDKIVRLHISQNCDKRFLCIINNHSAHARSYYAEKASGTSLSMKNVSREVIYGLVIPLPPFAEQQRIVAKVDELMALCDRLEAQLTTTQSESRHYLEALLHHALSA